MNWQPIETAPKDNSCILLYVPMKSIKFISTGFWDTVKKKWLVAWTGIDKPSSEIINPTHWCNLEAPE